MNANYASQPSTKAHAFILSTSRRLAECQTDCTAVRDGIGFSNSDYQLAFALIAVRDYQALATLLVAYRKQAGLLDDKTLLAEVVEISGLDPTKLNKARSTLKGKREQHRGRLSWIIEDGIVFFGGYTPTGKLRSLLDLICAQPRPGCWTIAASSLKHYTHAFAAATGSFGGTNRLARPQALFLAIGVTPSADHPTAAGLVEWRSAQAPNGLVSVELTIYWERRLPYRQSLRRKGFKVGNEIHCRRLSTRAGTAAHRQLALFVAAFPGQINGRDELFNYLFPNIGAEAIAADCIITGGTAGETAVLELSNLHSQTGEDIAGMLRARGMVKSATPFTFRGNALAAGRALIDILAAFGSDVILSATCEQLMQEAALAERMATAKQSQGTFAMLEAA